MARSLFLNKNSGFTLLEVLLAMTIIAMSLLAALRTTENTTRTLTRLQERTIAQWVAENALVSMRYRIDGIQPLAGRWQSTAEMADRTWFWIATSNPTGDPGILKIYVEVRRQENGPALGSITTYWPAELLSGTL